MRFMQGVGYIRSWQLVGPDVCLNCGGERILVHQGEGWKLYWCPINGLDKRGRVKHGCDRYQLTAGDGQVMVPFPVDPLHFGRAEADFVALAELVLADRAKVVEQMESRKRDDAERSRLMKIGTKFACCTKACPNFGTERPTFGPTFALRYATCPTCGVPYRRMRADLVKPAKLPKQAKA